MPLPEHLDLVYGMAGRPADRMQRMNPSTLCSQFDYIIKYSHSATAVFASRNWVYLPEDGCAEDTDAMLPVVKDALRLAGWSFTTMMNSRNESLL